MHPSQPPAVAPAPESGPAEETAPAPAGPRTPTEEMVAEVWRELLELDTVDVTEDFFELGGHSMMAVQVVYQIEERTGVALDLAVFFDLGTVAEVGAELDRLRSPDGSADEPLVEEGEL